MPRSSAQANVELRNEHRQALRRHAIELLKLGHGRLDASSFADSEEEDITGKLKEAIETLIEADPNAPRWVERYTVFDEEKPAGIPSIGKQRPRIDITIKRRWKFRQSHPRFRFEAKRLSVQKGISPYFGKDGIGCFLRGAYPLTHPEAGMIGYVQSGNLSDWQHRLGKYANREARRLRIVPGGEWKDYQCALPCSSISEHRHRYFAKLVVVHLLLSFCQKTAPHFVQGFWAFESRPLSSR
jgi:hypothetical protein